MLELKGYIKKIITKKDNGFCIVSFFVSHEILEGVPRQSSKVVVAVIKNGETLEEGNAGLVLGGEYVFNEKWQQEQFEVAYFYRAIPDDINGMRAFLVENIDGIGEKLADSIMEACGMDIVQILNSQIHLHLLDNIPGISETRIQKAKKSWDSEMQKRDLIRWLSMNGLSPALAPAIISALGESPMERIKEDPYSLALVSGIEFQEVDKIASEMGHEIAPKNKMKALLYTIVADAERSGSLAVPLHKVESEIWSVFDFTKENRDMLFSIILEDEEFSHYRAPEETDKTKTLVYLRKVFDSERYIAKFILDKLESNNHRLVSDQELEEAITKAESELSFPLLAEQKQAVRNAIKFRVSMIAGGGGCGKSTTIGVICRVLEILGNSRIVLTPTGSIANTLRKETGSPAKVIHAAIGVSQDVDIYENTPIALSDSVVVIDETGLVDNGAMFQIAKSLDSNSDVHVVFSGDTRQQSSVSPGNVLSDLMKSAVIPTVVLTKMKRSDEGSKISHFADLFHDGKFPDDLFITKTLENANFAEFRASGVVFHERETEQDTRSTFRELVLSMIRERGIHPSDIQAFSPIYDKVCGVNELNSMFQEILIEEKAVDGAHCVIHNGKRYCVGDRVHRSKKNDYKRNVFNGSSGYVTDVDTDAYEVEVDFGDGLVVRFSKSELWALDLAYCIVSTK